MENPIIISGLIGDNGRCTWSVFCYICYATFSPQFPEGDEPELLALEDAHYAFHGLENTDK